MKSCPQCRRTFQDDSLAYCLYDGHALVADASAAPAPTPPPPTPPPPAPRSGGGGRRVVGVLLGLAALAWAGRHVLHLGADPAGRDALVAAVQRADAAEVQAFKTLDDAPLTQCYTGAALAQEETKLQGLRQQGEYLDERITGAQVRATAVSADKQQAAVRLTETWDVTFYSQQTRQALREISDTVVPQTVLLRRSGNDWLVAATVPAAP